ncbi:unnamed protein product [Rotaria magnacalcarata]|uniref:Uncharacterized protein n=2 Tax=Rotaria magnacalcarata TaxID=392030 RepID=A0A816SWC8_9BILA|nr:unnamed protein product [Rotaria magnacalcarata]
MNLQCEKCGRRMKSEQRFCRHGHRLKCKRQARLFPTELPSCSMINRNSSRKSSPKSVLIDQFIRVQQINSARCNTLSQSYTYDLDSDCKNDEIKMFRFVCVQQMVYLRENINNLTYRELHFSSEYIVLKRLEEKNHLINQNRCKVDHLFRSLTLQYQTMSTLLQNITITSFNYSKQDVQSPYERLSLTENLKANKNTPNDIVNHSPLTQQNESFPIIVALDNDNNKQQQYSQNATKSNQENLLFDTAVTIDVTKCPQAKMDSFYRPYFQDNGTRIESGSDGLTFQNHHSYSYETMCFPPNSNQQVGLQYVSAHTRSSNQNSLTSTNSDTILYTSTTNKQDKSQPVNYTQSINKIKQILNILQNNLLHKTIPKNENMNQTTNRIDKSLSTTITSDSLISNTSIQTTYSVTSTLPILHKNMFPLLHTQSTINVQNELLYMDSDSLNFSRRKSQMKFLNSAQNINTNHQTSDNEDEEFLNYSQSRRVTIEYMSPSFMFALQILLILCLINRISMYYFLGSISNDPLTSIITNNAQSTTSIRKTEATKLSTNYQIFNNFVLTFFSVFE